MSYKIRKGFRIIILIIIFPIVVEFINFFARFLMQGGRILGTIIRIIMSF